MDEGEYFTSWVHRDIDAIMEDMWEVHRDRGDSVSECSVAEELKQDMEEVAHFNDSMLFCKQT